MSEIRLLRADEIDVRVGAVYENGCTLLLYKDARVDMNILDETFGVMGWKRRHYKIDEAMFCEVSIKNPETGEWISEADLGSPSFSEPLKGAASDAFKRACTNIGIGRELYTSPFIWVQSSKIDLREEKGKRVVKDKFHVQSIAYNPEKRSIEGIVICKQSNEVVFQFMEVAKVEDKTNPKKPKVMITPGQTAALLGEIERTGLSLPSVLKKHKLSKLSDMSPELWQKAMDSLKGLDDKVA